MIDYPVIVGCGTIGSSLALKLSKSFIVSNLDIYDFDTVSPESDDPPYPFVDVDRGLLKVDVVKYCCNLENENLKITSYPEKITEKINSGRFVIDCRDNKYPDIGASIRISLDGYLLYIDTLSSLEEVDYYRYISPKNEKYINDSIDFIIEFLKNDQYIHKRFLLYDLRTKNLNILQEEHICK